MDEPKRKRGRPPKPRPPEPEIEAQPMPVPAIAPLRREIARTAKESAEAFKSACADLVDNNIDQMDIWLKQVARDNPKAALDIMLALMEFHLPKLARKESMIDISVKREHIIDKLENLDGVQDAEFDIVSEVSGEGGSPQGDDC